MNGVGTPERIRRRATAERPELDSLSHEELVVMVRRLLAEARMDEVPAGRSLASELMLLRDAVETLPVGVTVTDLAGRVLYTNPAEAAMHGWSVEELEGTEARVLAPVELWRSLSFAQLDLLGEWRRESVNVRRDGTRFPVDLTSLPVRDRDGKLLGVVTLCFDASARHSAEEALRHRLAIEEAIASISRGLVTAQPGQEAEALRRALATLGATVGVDRCHVFRLSADGTVLRSIQEWCAPGISGRQAAALELRTALLPWWTARLVARRPVHLRSRPELPLDASGEGAVLEASGARSVLMVPMVIAARPVGFLGFDAVRDAREWEEDDLRLLSVVAETFAAALDRWRGEEELRRSEEQHRLLFELASDPILVIEPSSERVLAVNARACEVYGLARDRLVGSSLKAFTADVERGEAEIENVLRSGSCVNFETVHRTPDGRTLELLVSASVIPYQGAPAILSIHRDVGEQRRLAERLRQTQKMEAVGRLAGGVAHDFNNLLQAVGAQVELLDLHRADQERVGEGLAELRRHVRRGAQLARHLLLFSRRTSPRMVTVALADLVASSSELLKRLVRENVVLEIEPVSSNVSVRADPGQFEQVLMNLVVNAVQAMPEGGRVSISAGAGADGMAWLEVADSGQGIEPEVLPRIFEPFFTTKPDGEGTGLGLSVVHGIVEAHGGRVEVESTPGAGTTARVLLPRVARESAGAAATPGSGAAALRGEGQRVLLVEDDGETRALLRQVLEELGYVVEDCGTGEEAGLLPAEPPFDVLLTDYLLPGITGLDLARGLVDRWPGLRVILMSGYGAEQALAKATPKPSLRFLQKPFSAMALADELSHAVANRRQG